MCKKMVSILRPQELKKDFPDFSGGLGTPYLIFNSNTGEKLLLFTGWKDKVGLKREGAVVPIDEDLNVNVEKIKKILPSKTIPGNYTMNAIRGIYNPARDEFIVTTTHESKAYIFWFDSEWNKKDFKCILKSAGDHGVPFKPVGRHNLHDAVAAIPSSSRVKLLGLRNVDKPEKFKVEDYGVASWHGSNDVLDLTLMPCLSVIIESDEFGGKWVLKSFIGPPPSDVKGLNPEGGIPDIGLLEGDILPSLMVDDIFVHLGHPHYTTEPDGHPKLFFASFRDTWSTKKDTKKTGFTHEIYAVYVDNSIFDPRSYGILKDRIFVPDERSLPSKWYWTGSAKEILLIVSRVKKRKTSIKINEAASLYDVEDSAISSLEGLNKFVIESPSPFIKIEYIHPIAGPVWIIAKY